MTDKEIQELRDQIDQASRMFDEGKITHEQWTEFVRKTNEILDMELAFQQNPSNGTIN